MDTPRHDRDRLLCSPSGGGERSSNSDALGGQPISPKDERIVSASPSLPNTALADAAPQPGPLDAVGDSGTYHLGAFPGDSGFGSSMGTWNAYPQYINADGLHVVSPVVYNDNPSLVYHSGYGYNTDAAYGQYSPVGTPMPHLLVDGQLYPGQQLPFSPSYFPPNMPHISSADPMTLESSSIDNMFFGPTSGFLVNYGNLPGNITSSPITSPTVYPQPVGILGAYENNFGQQRSSHGFGLVSSSPYAHGGSYQSNNYNGASFPYSASNELNPLGLDKGRRRESDRDLISGSNDSRDSFNDRNRGPRASKVKGKMVTEQSSSSGGDNKLLSASGILLDSYNKLDFVFDYEDAKFFIIKSFSEDNVHKSIKYNVWASTPHGNKKLDAAYQESKEIKPRCPVFLFFSVNASGQFCGVAEMVGAVNFEKDAEYWQQDRWSGQFPVQWHIIKDVPNIKFRHILLENNDNKPVTHSRDSQEVGLKQGIEMLKIFKDHEARTSILEDFCFYDDREKASRERKARHQQAHVADNSSNETETETAAADELSVSLSEKLVVEENDNAVTGGSEKKRSSVI